MKLLSTLLFIQSLRTALAGDDAWHLDITYNLVNEQLDPIINPNGQASHMHKIMGGSNFGASFSYANMVASSCSSVANQADNSAYWMPSLYWNVNGSFVPIPSRNRFYYFLANNTVPFPDGLRIVAGSPSNKSPTNLAQFSCQQGADFSGYIGDSFNFATDCASGMKTEVYFPQCWDGYNLYKTDGSHMAYVVGDLRDGYCPWSHPVRVPTLLLEQTWMTSYYYPGKTLAGNLVWANGDSTGYGIHADFISAWKPGVLAAALKDPMCVGLGGSIPQTACPSLNRYIDNTAAAACRPSLGTLTEPYGNDDGIPVPVLPGCNLVWGATGSKPTCSPAVAPLNIAPFQGTDGSYVAAANQQYIRTLPTTPGWAYLGCVMGQASIVGGVSYSDAALTATSCQASCLRSGYAYAGAGQTGSVWNCVCGNSIDPNAPELSTACVSPCPGNATQTCGSSYVYSIFYAPPGTTAPTASLSNYNLGCYSNGNDNSKGIRGSTLNAYTSNSLTTESCTAYCINLAYTWAATLGGDFCLCGNNLAANIAPGTFVPDSYCTKPCTGNAAETCGDVYFLNVYNLTASSTTTTTSSTTSTVPTTTTPLFVASTANQVAAASRGAPTTSCSAVTVTQTVQPSRRALLPVVVKVLAAATSPIFAVSSASVVAASRGAPTTTACTVTVTKTVTAAAKRSEGAHGPAAARAARRYQ